MNRPIRKLWVLLLYPASCSSGLQPPESTTEPLQRFEGKRDYISYFNRNELLYTNDGCFVIEHGGRARRFDCGHISLHFVQEMSHGEVNELARVVGGAVAHISPDSLVLGATLYVGEKRERTTALDVLVDPRVAGALPSWVHMMDDHLREGTVF